MGGGERPLGFPGELSADERQPPPPPEGDQSVRRGGPEKCSDPGNVSKVLAFETWKMVVMRLTEKTGSILGFSI